MSTDPKVQELLAPMRDRSVDLGARRFKVDRERIVSRMVEASASEGATPSRRAYAILALAAGFALIAAGATYRTMHQGAVTAAAPAPIDVVALRGNVARLHGTARDGISPGGTATVAPEGALETSPNSEARIKTQGGLEIELRENTRVSLADLSTAKPQVALHLDSGAVRCTVPHLSEGRTFSVVTPDARIIDRGTIFTVTVEGTGEAARTIVRVEEGTVVVQHESGETQLTASQAWDSAAHAQIPLPPVVGTPAKDLAATAAETGARSPAAGAAVRRGTESPKQPRGTLDEETRLLRAGLAAERRGDLKGAAASFDLLLSRYPESPLAPDARAGRARVIQR